LHLWWIHETQQFAFISFHQEDWQRRVFWCVPSESSFWSQTLCNEKGLHQKQKNPETSIQWDKNPKKTQRQPLCGELLPFIYQKVECLHPFGVLLQWWFVSKAVESKEDERITNQRFCPPNHKRAFLTSCSEHHFQGYEARKYLDWSRWQDQALRFWFKQDFD